MASVQDELLKQAMNEITEGLTANLKVTLMSALEKQISESLAKSLVESAFYRRISKDMRNGLKGIYKEIANVAKAEDQAVSSKAQAEAFSSEKLAHEASRQLDEVLNTTEKATERIMELVEITMDRQTEASELIAKLQDGSITPEQAKRLSEINSQVSDDLTSIMTTLSFQDLTGQRIKKVVAALKQIEDTVVKMYLSTGLLIKAKEEKPEEDLEKIHQETKDMVAGFKSTSIVGSELKGPSSSGISQASIDDLLSQLDAD